MSAVVLLAIQDCVSLMELTTTTAHVLKDMNHLAAIAMQYDLRVQVIKGTFGV